MSAAGMLTGRRLSAAACRVVIENITPQVDCGRFAAKRVARRERARRGATSSPTATTPSPPRCSIERRKRDEWQRVLDEPARQ